MTIESTFKDKINWKSYNLLLDIATSLEDRGHNVTLDICTLDRMDIPNCLCYYNTDTGFTWFTIRDFLCGTYLKEYEKRGVIYRIQVEDQYINAEIKQKILDTGKFVYVTTKRSNTVVYYKEK